jgi:hypothetical protein
VKALAKETADGLAERIFSRRRHSLGPARRALFTKTCRYEPGFGVFLTAIATLSHKIADALVVDVAFGHFRFKAGPEARFGGRSCSGRRGERN